MLKPLFYLILFLPTFLPTSIRAEVIWREIGHLHNAHTIPLVPTTGLSSDWHYFNNNVSGLSVTFKSSRDINLYLQVKCNSDLNELKKFGTSVFFDFYNKVRVSSVGTLPQFTLWASDDMTTYTVDSLIMKTSYARMAGAEGFSGEAGEFYCAVRPTGNIWPEIVTEQTYIRISFSNASSWAVPAISASASLDLGRCSKYETLTGRLPVQISYRGIHTGLVGTLKAQLLTGEETLTVLNQDGDDLLQSTVRIPETVQGYYPLTVSSLCPERFGQHEWQMLLIYSIE